MVVTNMRCAQAACQLCTTCASGRVSKSLQSWYPQSYSLLCMDFNWVNRDFDWVCRDFDWVGLDFDWVWILIPTRARLCTSTMKVTSTSTSTCSMKRTSSMKGSQGEQVKDSGENGCQPKPLKRENFNNIQCHPDLMSKANQPISSNIQHLKGEKEAEVWAEGVNNWQVTPCYESTTCKKQLENKIKKSPKTSKYRRRRSNIASLVHWEFCSFTLFAVWSPNVWTEDVKVLSCF